jgi:hypothetical protein
MQHIQIPETNARRFAIVFFFLAGFCFSSSCFSQTRCPPGATPGSVVCQPDISSDPASGTRTIVRSTGYWQNTWGAIADGSNGIGGVAVGSSSKEEALDAARKACEKNGGLDCEAGFSYYNQCAAIAQPTRDFEKSVAFRGSAENKQLAIDNTLKACREQNVGDQCKVVYSDCTEQIFHKY